MVVVLGFGYTIRIRGLPERPNGAVLKTVGRSSPLGSNPRPSARFGPYPHVGVVKLADTLVLETSA